MVETKRWSVILILATFVCGPTVISDALAENNMLDSKPSNVIPGSSGRSFHTPGNVDITNDVLTFDRNSPAPAVSNNPGNVPDETRSFSHAPVNVDVTHGVAVPAGNFRSSSEINPNRTFNFPDYGRGDFFPGTYGGTSEGLNPGGQDTTCIDCGDTSGGPYGAGPGNGHYYDDTGFHNKP